MPCSPPPPDPSASRSDGVFFRFAVPPSKAAQLDMVRQYQLGIFEEGKQRYDNGKIHTGGLIASLPNGLPLVMCGLPWVGVDAALPMQLVHPAAGFFRDALAAGALTAVGCDVVSKLILGANMAGLHTKESSYQTPFFEAVSELVKDVPGLNLTVLSVEGSGSAQTFPTDGAMRRVFESRMSGAIALVFLEVIMAPSPCVPCVRGVGFSTFAYSIGRT